MKTLWISAALVSLVATSAQAKLKTETIEYKHGDVVLEGYFAYDDAIKTKRPAVIVVHEWFGPNPNQRARADQLAQMGYVGFAIDMYGKNVRPKNHEEAGQTSGALRKDRTLMRARITAALDRLKQHGMVDANRVAAIGYCFGGTSVVELARSGAAVKAVVSFHGGLDSPKPEDGKNIKAAVQIHHGADDPFVPPEGLAAFEKEMKDHKVDYWMNKYSGAVHSFTVKEAGNDPSKGMAYNEAADHRSWEAMKILLQEKLK